MDNTSSAKQYYDQLEHTADWAIRVWGADLPSLFAHAAAAIFEMMSLPPAEETLSREVCVTSPDVEALLVDWLNELIYQHEVEHETYQRFEITDFTPEALTAVVYGGSTVRKLKTVKAATFHDLAIRRVDGQYEAHIVFDV